MNNADTPRTLHLLDTDTGSSGCGCGGCGCHSTDASTGVTDATETPMADQTSQSFAVTGMTCGHCASAVTNELKTLDGVTDVRVALVAGGTSTVTVTSQSPLEKDQVIAALDEAGDYQIA